MSARTAAAVVGLGLWVTAVEAHHSITGIYDATRPLTFDGVVAAFQFVNPHPFVEFDVRDASGRAERWRGEMDNRFELVGVGMTAETLRPGDRITITGSAARDGGRSVYVRSLERPADSFLYEQVGSSPRVRLPKR
jgi:hypothetical protein